MVLGFESLTGSQLMIYFVGYLIEGEAAKYYQQITTDLAARFGIANLSLRIPPHFTFKPPFESDNINPFKKTLGDIASSQTSLPIDIDGFDRYGLDSKTIYLNVRKDDGLNNKILKIIDQIKDFGEKKKPLPDNFRLHASIARHLTSEQSAAIWNYLQTLPPPHFELNFDNLTLFRLADKIWQTEKTWRF